MPDLLRFAGLHRRFDRLPVLTGVSGEVRSGEVLLITGANGSGKSTLLRCLAGLLAADSGEIAYREGGRDVETWERRLKVGYLAPDLAFYEELTVEENLHFFARMRRLPRSRVDEMLERVYLPADRLAGALSSGMLQRLRWGWALLHRPRLLLLDEPFQNLDEAGQESLAALLAEHLDSGGLAAVANPRGLEVPHVAQHLQLAG